MRTSDRTARGIWIEPSGEGKALVVDGAVQSVTLTSPESLFGYWPLMLPDVRPQQALVLGLGGGTLVQLLFRRFGPLPLLAVDDDERVVALATAEMGLDPASLTIVIADAFEWVAKAQHRFDYVAIDLYRGGEVPARAFTSAFLRNLRRLLTPGATVVLNMAADRQAQARLIRFARWFRVDGTRKFGKNLIVHAHTRPR
jgi:spermidine synthase